VPGDSELLLRWANEPDVRNQAFSSEPIGRSTHEAWYASKLRDPGCVIGILETTDHVPLGQVRFDAGPAGIEVDIAVDPAFRGRGVGQELLRQGLEAAAGRWPRGTPVIAEVLTSNTASRRLFERCGFMAVETDARHRKDFVRFEHAL
jgi:UDP-2,4-diacetamido-2,4,6-trideoxy-beta-L-altropyranose hydrolase